MKAKKQIGINVLPQIEEENEWEANGGEGRRDGGVK